MKSAFEIFKQLIATVSSVNSSLKWFSWSNDERFKEYKKPGAVINFLSQEERNELQKLTSDEIKDKLVLSEYESMYYWVDKK